MSTTPERIGPYRILRHIGTGGMGAVYEALRDGESEAVALKLKHTHDRSEHSIQLFSHEAAMARQVDHPGFVRVIDVGVLDGQHFYTMELVRGQALGDWVREQRPSIRAIVAVISATARAIQHAHERGILHGDLKPANVIVTEAGEPKVVDFGVARLMGAEPPTTEDGETLGTPRYMSPEQVRGDHKHCGPESDVWSLGVVLYELLAGTPPFTGRQVLDVMKAVARDIPMPPSQHREEVSSELDRVVMQCLEKDPVFRYRSAAELADDLDRFENGVRVQARSNSRKGVTGRYLLAILHRHEASVILLLVTLLAGAWWFVTPRGDADDAGLPAADGQPSWQTVYEWSFDRPLVEDLQLEFRSADLRQPGEPWPQGSDGLRPDDQGWLWFTGLNVPGDCRVTLDVSFGDQLDGLDVLVNSSDLPQREPQHVPPGYACQFAGEAGTRHVISRNAGGAAIAAASAAPAHLLPHQRYRLMFMREGDRLTMQVDGSVVHSARYLKPIDEGELNRVGIRSWNDGHTVVHNIRIECPE